MTAAAEETLDRLLEGNRRFVEGRAAQRDFAARRAEVAAGQRPFAIVLSCSDSRVPPELVFDQGLGDLFVCRVAGNVVTPEVLGTIEYAVGALGCHFVLVLGHHRCGAVAATMELLDTGGTAPGNVQSIVDAIVPNVDEGASVDDVVRANALAAAQRLRESAALSDSAHIAAAVYSLDTGVVEVL